MITEMEIMMMMMMILAEVNLDVEMMKYLYE
jgi:hypothetical protein